MKPTKNGSNLIPDCSGNKLASILHNLIEKLFCNKAKSWGSYWRINKEHKCYKAIFENVFFFIDAQWSRCRRDPEAYFHFYEIPSPIRFCFNARVSCLQNVSCIKKAPAKWEKSWMYTRPIRFPDLLECFI